MTPAAMSGRRGSFLSALSQFVGTTITNVAILLAGLAISGLLLWVTGVDVAAAGMALVEGALGGPEAIRQTLIEAVPIMIAGLGVSFALRAGLVNLGADGQLYAGAFAAALFGMYGPALPAPAGVVLVLVAGAFGGLIWGAIPGWLRARLAMSEVITTLLLNFVAFWIVSYAVHGPIQDPTGGGYPWTPEIPAGMRLPALWIGGFFLPSGVLVGVAVAAVISLVLHRTNFGFELRVLGANPAAARWAGVHVSVRIVEVMAISGALAGLAGAAELAGNQYRLSDFFSNNFGFTALVVALVGRASPSGTVAAGLFFGALAAGAASMERLAAVPASAGLVVQGVVIAILVASRTAVARAAIGRLRPRREAVDEAAE